MHVPEPSVGGVTANLLHASSIPKPKPKPESTAAHVRDGIPVFLLQPVWSVKHLRTLNVRAQDDFPLSSLFSKFHLPKDGSDDFEELASEISAPFTNTTATAYRNTFHPSFSFLRAISTSSHSLDPVNQTPCTTAATSLLTSLIETILPYTNDEGSLRVSPSPFPFHLHRLGVKGLVPGDASIIKTDIYGSAPPLPVTAITIIPPSTAHHTTTAVQTQEAAQLILQAALAFEHPSTFDIHTSFVVRVSGTELQVIAAEISRAFVDGLYSGVPCRDGDGIEVCRSEEFEMMHPSGRREALRAMFALLRTVCARPGRRWMSR